MGDTRDTANITAVILAGGKGSRMGGVDKGLQIFKGQALAQHVLARIQPQVRQTLINANRHTALYQTWGCTVFTDAHDDLPYLMDAGPLAGMAAGIAHAKTPYVLVVPCDTPLIPLDLAQRLLAGIQDPPADIAIAYTREATSETEGAATSRLVAQPTCCLLSTTLLPSLIEFIQHGGRKVREWTALHRCVKVIFDTPQDHPLAFANVNTLADLQALEDQISGT